MAHDVFISHSSKDANTALALCSALEAKGIRCWIAPRDIPGGAIWAEAILAGLGAAQVQVVVFSSHANRSEHVRTEIDAAVRRGLIIIPFRIENVPPEGVLEFHLQSRHWLDALTPPVEAHIRQLVNTVVALLEGKEGGVDRTPPPTAPEPVEPAPAASPQSPPPVAKRWSGLTGRGRLLGAIGITWAVALIAVLWSLRGEDNLKSFTWRPAGTETPLKARVTSMRFFEGGRATPARDARHYATYFRGDRTRYIYLQLHLQHDQPPSRAQLPIACTHLTEDGAVEGTISKVLSVAPDARASDWVVGWGSMAPGRWTTGRVTTECRYGDQVIATGTFEVGTEAPPGAGPDFPEINADVVDLKFFEAGSATPSRDDRLYAERFSSATARYIYVELRTEHVPLGHDSTTSFVCTYRNPDNSVFFDKERTLRVKSDYRNTWYASGAGWAAAGKWKPGRYRVECEREGRLLISKTFEVVAAPTPRIPVLNGNVTGLRFYEYGRGFPPVDQRVYRTRFPVATTRFINFELRVEHDRTTRAISVALVCEYRRDGGLVGTVNATPTVPRGRVGPSLLGSGWGQADRGKWEIGRYEVRCSHLKKEIARASFTIE